MRPARTWGDAIGDACDAYAAGDDSKLDLALRLVEAAGSRMDGPAPDPIMVEVFTYRDGIRVGLADPLEIDAGLGVECHDRCLVDVR